MTGKTISLTVSQKRHITIFNIVVPFLIGITIDLYVPSLPHIAAYYHVSKDLVQFTVALYLLGYGIGQFVLGILSDTFGRRKIFLTSTVFFVAVSFLSALSPNIYVLNLCRFLQGLGIAGMAASRNALAMDCFSGVELAKVMAVISTSWAIGPIVGPYIGGYLQHCFGWKSSFYFFGFYGLFIFLFTIKALPETNLDPQIFRAKRIFNSLRVIIKHPAFMMGMIILALSYSMIVIFNTIGPFLIQGVLRYSAVTYGKIALFMGLGYFIGTLINQQLLRFVDSLKIAFVGMIGAVLTSLIMLSLTWVPMNLYVIIFPACLLFIFCGLIFPNVFASCMSLFPKMAGTANALYGIFGTGGVFVFTMLSAFLKANSQRPMAVAYLVMSLACFLLFGKVRAKFN